MGQGPQIFGLVFLLSAAVLQMAFASNEQNSFEPPKWLKELNKTWSKESESVFHQAEALRNDDYDDSFAFVFRIFFISFMCIFFLSFMCACRRACCGRRRIQAGAILSQPPGTTSPTIINIHRNRTAPGGYTQVATHPVGAQIPGPLYQTYNSQYGTTTATSHYPAPGGGSYPIQAGAGAYSAPQVPGFKDLPPPPPYEPPQPGFNPAYASYPPQQNPAYPQQPQAPQLNPSSMPPPPSYSEKS